MQKYLKELLDLVTSLKSSSHNPPDRKNNMPLIAATVVFYLISSVLPAVSALGINCQGSALCDRAGFNNQASVSIIQLLRDVVWASSKSNSTTYASGDHILCISQSQQITIDAGVEIDGLSGGVSLSGNIGEGGICLFPQYLSSGSLTLGQIRPLVDAILDHKCTTCGSVPVHFVDEGSNDPGAGILTFNYVASPICDHNCITDTGTLESSGSAKPSPSATPSPSPSPKLTPSPSVKSVTVVETPPGTITKSTPSTTAPSTHPSTPPPSTPAPVTQTGPVTIVETNPFVAPQVTAQGSSTPTTFSTASSPNAVTTAAPTTVTMAASSTPTKAVIQSSSTSTTPSVNGPSTVTEPAPVTVTQGGNAAGAIATTPTQNSNTVSPSPNAKSAAGRLQNQRTCASMMVFVMLFFNA